MSGQSEGRREWGRGVGLGWSLEGLSEEGDDAGSFAAGPQQCWREAGEADLDREKIKRGKFNSLSTKITVHKMALHMWLSRAVHMHS